MPQSTVSLNRWNALNLSGHCAILRPPASQYLDPAVIKRKIAKLMDALASRVARAQVNLETHPFTILRQRAAKEAADFIELHGRNAILVQDQRELIDYALSRVTVDGLYMEFGVHRGASIRHIANQIDRAVYGFDSFEGLPTDGTGTNWRQSQFNCSGDLPTVPDNAILCKGWFDQTLPTFLENNTGCAAFIHIDCDLYESALYVLNSVGERMTAGTILLFDDWFNFPGWQGHEYRAFQEFQKRCRVAYRHIGFARQQTAIIIEQIG